jgi:hypothetical protein
MTTASPANNTTTTNAATSNPDEAIQKTLAEDAKARVEKYKKEEAVKSRFLYSFHPKAEIFPLMKDDELVELGKNIVANGLLEPITLKDRMILDGRNRYRACQQLGHEFSEKDFVELPASVDPLAFVISKNIVRRHLTAEQKREVIAVLLKENPNASSRAIAGLAKVSHHTVEDVRQAQEATGQSAQLETEAGEAGQPAQKRTGRDGKKRKTPTKAKKSGPSPTELKQQVDNFIAEWPNLNSWQQRYFVKTYQLELSALCEEIAGLQGVVDEGEAEAAPAPKDESDIPSAPQRTQATKTDDLRRL